MTGGQISVSNIVMAYTNHLDCEQKETYIYIQLLAEITFLQKVKREWKSLGAITSQYLKQ